MAEDTDGVSETFDDSLRIALTISSQFAERITRLREQLSLQREASAQQEYRELEARFESERGAARASLAPVQNSEWWNTARPEDIAAAHETATVWRAQDDKAHEASERIRREVQERYGIDVEAPGARPEAVAAALRDAERDRAQARTERERAAQELTASQLLLASADRRDRDEQDIAEAEWRDGREDTTAPGLAAEERLQSELAYDSAERRQRFAASLEGTADQKAIDARILADGENAKHPREAVLRQPGQAPKPRKRSKGAAQERTRGGLAR